MQSPSQLLSGERAAVQAESVAGLAGREAVAEQALQFSGAIPTPLSMTEMRTPRDEASVRSVISLSGRPDSSQAYLALRTRLTRICSTLCLSTVIGGTALNSPLELHAVTLEGARVQAQAVLDQRGDLDGLCDAAELGIALLHHHGVLDVLEIVAQQT